MSPSGLNQSMCVVAYDNEVGAAEVGASATKTNAEDQRRFTTYGTLENKRLG